MILSFSQFLQLAESCPEEEIVVMSETEFNNAVGEITDNYWHRIENREGFFHSRTGEPLGLLPDTRLECVDPTPTEIVRRFVILQNPRVESVS